MAGERIAVVSQNSARLLTFVVKLGREQREYVTGKFPCDGQVHEDGISRLERGQVLVYLEGGPAVSAYAVIVPMPAE